MRNGTRHLLVGSTAVTVALAGTLAVNASWSIPGASAVKARSAAMPRGEEPEVTKRTQTALVSWDRQEIAPGSPMDHYIVTAHHVGATIKPDITRTVPASGDPIESVIFTTEEMAGGTWRWTVTPKLHLWVGLPSKESRPLTFPAGPAAKSVSPAASAPLSGSSVSRVPPPTPRTSSSPAPAAPADSRPEPTPPAPPESDPQPVAPGVEVPESQPADQ
jgi:hypothetical protein